MRARIILVFFAIFFSVVEPFFSTTLAKRKLFELQTVAKDAMPVLAPPPVFQGFKTSASASNFMIIPFVERYAEVFDAMTSVLSTAQGFVVPNEKKKAVPLATQTMGVGKTFLGCHLVYALNRPREDPAFEDEVAERLLTSLKLQEDSQTMIMGYKRLIRKAKLMKGIDESLITRALRVFLSQPQRCLERVDELIDMVKRCKTIVVNFEMDMSSSLLSEKKSDLTSFEGALANATVKAAAGEEGFQIFITAYSNKQRSIDNAIDLLVSWYGPIMIVLDEVSSLSDSRFAGYFDDNCGQAEARFTSAMKKLSSSIKIMLSRKGVFVYCAGRSSMLTTGAMSGDNSPLFSRPVIIHPLRVRDVAEILSKLPQKYLPTFLRTTKAPEDDDPHRRVLQEYYISELVRLSGGNGRVIELVLTSDQFHATKTCKSIAEVDILLRRPGVVDDYSLMPTENYINIDELEKLLQHIVEYLLLGKTFPIEETVTIEGLRMPVPLCVVLNSFGMSYTTFTVGKDRRQKGDKSVQIVVGAWQLDVLQKRFTSEDSQKMLTLYQSIMESRIGTDRGSRFAEICYHACLICLQQNANRAIDSVILLKEALPHFSGSFVGDIQIPRGLVLAEEMFPCALSTATNREVYKALLPQESLVDKCPAIAPDDFAHALVHRVHAWTLVSPKPQSESQDWFLCLPKGIVIGFANKAYSKSRVRWGDINTELTKGKSQEYVKYCLVVYATQYGLEVMSALGDKHSIRFPAGKYKFDKKSGEVVEMSDADAAKASFEVAENQELIIVNPNEKGGLSALLGQKTLDGLLKM